MSVPGAADYHPGMVNGMGQVGLAGLAAWAIFSPERGSWAFAGAEALFLAWLSLQVQRVDGAALVQAAAQPLDGDEADVVRRYAFYFGRRRLARECAALLAMLGLASVLLVPWLIYRVQWPQALFIGACVFGVAALTRRLAPLLALRLEAAKGDREALRLLAAHDGAASKLG